MKNFTLFKETQSQTFSTLEETIKALKISEKLLRKKGDTIINKFIAKTTLGDFYHFKIISSNEIYVKDKRLKGDKKNEQ